MVSVFSSTDTYGKILSCCAGIHQLLGRTFKRDHYKWILISELKNFGFSCQMCGLEVKTDLYADIIKAELPEDRPVYIIVRADETWPEDDLCYGAQADHRLIVNFGQEQFAYRIVH
jgi:hypothetical protein